MKLLGAICFAVCWMVAECNLHSWYAIPAADQQIFFPLTIRWNSNDIQKWFPILSPAIFVNVVLSCSFPLFFFSNAQSFHLQVRRWWGGGWRRFINANTADLVLNHHERVLDLLLLLQSARDKLFGEFLNVVATTVLSLVWRGSGRFCGESRCLIHPSCSWYYSLFRFCATYCPVVCWYKYL